MADNSLQKNQLHIALPALDPDFLVGDSMRGVCLQLEYAKAGATPRMDSSINYRGIW